MNVLVKKYEESALTRSSDCGGGGGRRFSAFSTAMRAALAAAFDARRAVFGALAVCALAAGGVFTACEQVTDPPKNNEPEETGPLTEGFNFVPTVEDLSHTEFDFDAWSGEGTKNERWTLKVVEQPVTYFGVYVKGKTESPIQTITVGGPAAGLVTIDGADDILDDSPDGRYALFSVRTDDFDMMFDGGKKYFTLKVSEAGHSSVTVHVTIASTPDLSVGTAVFRVLRPDGKSVSSAMTAAEAEAWARSGILERIPFAEIKTILYGNSVQPASTWDETATGHRALDAIAWVDQYAQTGEEYLIRIEKNEELPQMRLVRDFGVTMRLRGANGADVERVLAFNGRKTAGSSANTYTRPDFGELSTTSCKDGVFDFFSKTGQFTASIEKNVTLKGFDFVAAGNGNNARSIVVLSNNTTFIMLDGSKLTGMRTSVYEHGAVKLSGGQSSGNNNFWMFGGVITGNQMTNTDYYESGYGYAAAINLVYSSGQVGCFVKKGGSVTGNTDAYSQATKEVNSFYYRDPVTKKYIRQPLEDGKTYVLPPVT